MISPPDRRRAVELIDGAVSAGASRQRACEALEISLRSYQRWTQGGGLRIDGRPGADRPAPPNKLSAEERARIVELCNEPRFQSLPPTQMVPMLADEGTYLASESSFYRVLREAGQLAHRGRAQAARTLPKPKGHRADGPNQVWSWDITYLAAAVAGTFYRLYLAMDIYSRKIVGWEIHASETAAHAAQLIRKACWAEGITERGLVLHSDNGAPMKGATMLATLQRLGVVPSFSRPSVSDDNPFSESLFRTLKYTPAYPSKPFESIEAARAWVHRFVHWYNEVHHHSGIRFVTPAARHRGEDRAILAAREAVYTAAKQHHPERWSGRTRDWSPIEEVWLNPEKTNDSNHERLKMAA